jgi:hypothetical protein
MHGLLRLVVVVAAMSGLPLAACEADGPALPPAGPGAAPITIVTTPPGASVTINGIPVGTAPITVSLNPGPARVRATMSGYYPPPETRIVVERQTAATHTIALVASH